MNKLSNHAFLYLIAFIIIGLLLGGAQYLQNQGVAPCPLCILQRWVFGLLGITFIFGVWLSKKRFGQWLIGLLSLVFSCLGLVVAGRQVYLQFLPSEAGANCEVSLEYMLGVLPFDQVLQKVFQGSTACSHVGWQAFGLSLAQWSLIFFILFFLFSIVQLRKGKRR